MDRRDVDAALAECAVSYRQTPDGAVAAYAPPSAGPFMCANCEYYDHTQCHRDEVIAEFKRLRGLRMSATAAPVDAAACCNFFEKA